MPDRISLLPDAVANQIAAGEVVQRPASLVKELLENAIDAQAKHIDLIIKDAGRTLVQVIDDGCGMSTTDARLSFERHATSKIKTTDDLFHIATKGFRGEALASIAAVAQVELKSKTEGAETATHLQIQGSEVVKQDRTQAAKGTSIAVKQLFYNVPARRNFLKSDAVELRHSIDEFQRIALSHPEVSLNMRHNDKELFNLPQAKLRQRIVNIFGRKINDKLVPIEEQTAIVKITGFIGKSDAAKKKRGEQFFFVNHRFVRNPYLNHAIVDAYKDLINTGHHPSYFIYFSLDPAKIDINIHPTKTEVKFEDEKAIYAILRSSVRHALGLYNVTPSLDFSSNPELEISNPDTRPVREPKVQVDQNFNPFSNSPRRQDPSPAESQAWQKLYDETRKPTPETQARSAPQAQSTTQAQSAPQAQPRTQASIPLQGQQKYFQVHECYILTQVKNGLLLIHQHRAHQRILYDKFLKALQQTNVLSQRLLFPIDIELRTPEIETFEVLRDELLNIGFDFELKQRVLSIHSTPVELKPEQVRPSLEQLLEEVQNNDLTQAKLKESTALVLATRAAIQKGQSLSRAEMHELADTLFASPEHSFSPRGKRIYNILSLDEIAKRLQG